MTELVINAPYLQTYGQRFGAVALTVLGWLLWCYIFFPLVTLSCWLVDNEVCSQWVNLAGGYLNLQQLLSVYLQTIFGLTLLWGGWVLYNMLRQRRGRKAPLSHRVSAEDLCAQFRVEPMELALCQASRYAIVHFDEAGHIIALEPGNHR